MSDVHNVVTVSFQQKNFSFLLGIILMAFFLVDCFQIFFYDGSSIIITYNLNKILKLPDVIESN